MTRHDTTHPVSSAKEKQIQSPSYVIANSREVRVPKATTSKPSKRTSPPAPPTSPLPVVHQLHALLHTMRVIEGHEEHLCSLMHHIQTTGQLTPAITRELRTLLDRLPTLAYQADLDSLQHALAVPTTKPNPRPGTTKR